MTTQLLIYCLLIGLLGIIAQVCIKINSLKNKAAAANTSFTVKSYLANDWPNLLLSLVFVFACIIATDEILKWKPVVVDYVKAVFFFVGYTGSSLFNAIMSKTEKKIMGVIDTKTDIADNISKP